ncbi:protein of unknown function [Flaviramulus basaltis]|uniref:Bacteroides conjugative transposon TraN protein n=1 Tax=Flaviramulus basaltis TaxID=369401 RepID=A0A1K2IB55_9FLAO|nr:DUF4138 domain-containing protein [Flaviramulus basaltis]SFZ89506.1 protein of unknown function [Flaviramulus basaltis]
MKAYIIITVIIFSNYLRAQKPLDTIYANESKNVALFFPESIRQGITGANHFVFTYNREKEQSFGLLQATPGIESNLLAITKNGKIYSYILKYKKQLGELNYFITEEESIGMEYPTTIEQSPILKSQSLHKNRVKYFQKFSGYLLKSRDVSIVTDRNKGLKLQLQKITYNGSEVYLVFGVKNNSEIDFEVGYLKVFRVNGNNRRKASYQRLEQEIVYEHSMPNVVEKDKSNRFVIVFPKFVLGKNEKLEIELQELNGDRKLLLKN